MHKYISTYVHDVVAVHSSPRKPITDFEEDCALKVTLCFTLVVPLVTNDPYI